MNTTSENQAYQTTLEEAAALLKEAVQKNMDYLLNQTEDLRKVKESAVNKFKDFMQLHPEVHSDL